MFVLRKISTAATKQLQSHFVFVMIACPRNQNSVMCKLLFLKARIFILLQKSTFYRKCLEFGQAVCAQALMWWRSSYTNENVFNILFESRFYHDDMHFFFFFWIPPKGFQSIPFNDLKGTLVLYGNKTIYAISQLWCRIRRLFLLKYLYSCEWNCVHINSFSVESTGIHIHIWIIKKINCDNVWR